MLEKNGDQLDVLCEKYLSLTQSEGGKEHHTSNEGEGRLTGLVTSCLVAAP